MSKNISKTFDYVSSLTLSGAIEHLIEHVRQNIESCLPAQFVKYDDRDKGLAVVSPLVKFPYVSGNKTVWKERPQFTVRILRVKSGGFWFEMPLKKGDTGWIIAADRDTSFAISRNANVDESKNTKENGGGPQEYSNFNKLKYSFGFFLPDGYCNLKVEKGHEDSSFWSMLKDDGSGDSDSYIELKKDGTVVIHPGGEEEKVLIEGFLDVSKNVNINGTVTAEKKNADGTDNEDPVEIKDTEYLVPIDKDENLYAIWKGRSFRNKGETGEPFKLTGGGGEGGEGGDMSEVDIDADPYRFVEVDGKTLYASVRKDAETGTTFVGLTEQAPGDEDDEDGGDGVDDYCNNISDDDTKDGNGISASGIGGSGSDSDPEDRENDISNWPCKKNDEVGENDL